MDHQVEDDVDVGAARLERGEPVRLDEQGLAQHVGQRQDRGVEALEMADLKHDAARVRERDQRVRLLERRRDRFFEQDMQAGIEKLARDREMRPRRHHDARGLDPARELADVAQREGTKPCPERPRPLELAVDHRDQLGARQRRIFLGVMPAEMAATDDRGAHRRHRRDLPSGWRCAREPAPAPGPGQEGNAALRPVAGRQAGPVRAGR